MQTKQDENSLIWFTNNLRIHDNSALKKAIKNSNQTIAVYCFDPRQFETSTFGFKKTENYRAQFLIETITDLRQQLSTLNIPLFVYTEKPEHCIPALIKNQAISSIYLQQEWTDEAEFVLNEVKKNCPQSISFIESYDQFLFHPEDIPFNTETLPKVFTVFRKQLEKQTSVRPLTHIDSQSPDLKTIENDTKIPTLEDLGLGQISRHANTAFPFKGGETEALKRLHSYFFETKKLGVYKKTRNGLIGTEFSSKFSPWLANGSLSAKQIYYEVNRFEKEHFKNESTYWLLFELLWRDYFKYVSLKHGNQIFKLGGLLNKNYDWSQDSTKIKQWIDGKTEEPFVNANMLELKKTGWMSNRGRQNVASYFAKTLQLDWRIGASYFESLLIDYDVHSNYGNWMYVAGVGNDPRDRKFNVKLQAERYDTNGKYQRLWLQDTLF